MEQAKESPDRPKATLPFRVFAKDWSLPPLSLLRPPEPPVAADHEQSTISKAIEQALAEHGVEVRVAEIRPGPAVTMYGLAPGWNYRGAKSAANGAPGEGRSRVRVDAILAREKDLALALAAPSLRIEAPVPGESVVGIEVPNRKSQVVTMRTVMASESYKKALEKDGLPVALGVGSAGEPTAIDLLTMPHLLIAGATGSGKSVCINTIIASLIKDQHPSKVRMLLIDPKRVELTPYNGIPHLVNPVVVEPDRVVRLMRGAVEEMLRRYKLLEEAGSRNIQSYNKNPRAKGKLPYFVICIDELADLMMTSAVDVEQCIIRLAQLGRATGIHMIIATQRPSVNVITGLIKANMPSRMSFSVASQIDSRTILDTAGAEKLLGRGDMLFLPSDAAKPRRIQGVYISEEEAEALANFWRAQNGPPPEPIDLEGLARAAEKVKSPAGGDADDDADGDDALSGDDRLYERALQIAVANKQVSTSMLQRKLRIGYPRAARLMEQFEEEGVVGPSREAGKPREVIYQPPSPATPPPEH
ncbi:MAG: DNA translocase FtsK [SAR202 cluster bacterium]|nr:DNA translocase FtsK [SAR202 cluster bacterium]